MQFLLVSRSPKDQLCTACMAGAAVGTACRTAFIASGIVDTLLTSYVRGHVKHVGFQASWSLPVSVQNSGEKLGKLEEKGVCGFSAVSLSDCTGRC